MNKPIGVRDSDEGLKMFSGCFHGSLIVESHSSNAIAWVLWNDNIPWRFHYFLSEVRSLSSLIQMMFKCIDCLGNVLMDFIAKQAWMEMKSYFLLLTLDVFYFFYFCFERDGV